MVVPHNQDHKEIGFNFTTDHWAILIYYLACSRLGINRWICNETRKIICKSGSVFRKVPAEVTTGAESENYDQDRLDY
jgi:hypothetical protein